MGTPTEDLNSDSIVYAVSLYDGEHEYTELFNTEGQGQKAFEAAIADIQTIARRELGDHDYELRQSLSAPTYRFAGVSIYWTTLSQKMVYG